LVSYGPRMRACVTLLSVFATVPADRCCQVVQSLFGVPISTGTVMSVLDRAYEGLEDFEAQVIAAVKDAAVVHADETGLRVEGKLWWLHTACTKAVTWLGVHPKRGRAAMNDFGVLGAMSGTLVTDALGAYQIYGARRGLCGAHVLRDLQQVIDFPAPGVNPLWAKLMRKVLLDGKKAADEARAAGQVSIDPQVLAVLRSRYDYAWGLGITISERAGDAKGLALAKRLRDHKDAYQLSWVDLEVPFDNNTAERALRMSKVRLCREFGDGCLLTLLEEDAVA